MGTSSHGQPAEADSDKGMVASLQQGLTWAAWCAGRNPESTVGSAYDGDVSIPIGTHDPRARSGQPAEQSQVRMPVRIVGAYAHHGNPGPYEVEQRRILVHGAVMGHLQHVGPQTTTVHIGQ